jgi:hypothetical protein
VSPPEKFNVRLFNISGHEMSVTTNLRRLAVAVGEDNNVDIFQLVSRIRGGLLSVGIAGAQTPCFLHSPHLFASIE